MNKLSRKIDYNDIIETDNTPIAPGEIIIGFLEYINLKGEPCVNFPGNTGTEALPAFSTMSITGQQIGKKVAILFANGNLDSPVIMGIIHEPLNEMLESFNQKELTDEKADTGQENTLTESEVSVDDLLIDGNKITFEANEIIELKCGSSSITLTKDGKIIIKGKYILNKSSGVNRIRGGSVQVN